MNNIADPQFFIKRRIDMWYDPKIIKYPRNIETGIPSHGDLLKIMDEFPEYRYFAITDYIDEAIKRNEQIDIASIEDKYYSHPVDTCSIKYYLVSYYYLAYYYYINKLNPQKAVEYLKLALLDAISYDSASALLIRFYLEGYGVERNESKAKGIWKKAREEISSWPRKFEIHPYSVFNMEL